MCLLDAVTWVTVESMDVITVGPEPYSCYVVPVCTGCPVVTSANGE